MMRLSWRSKVGVNSDVNLLGGECIAWPFIALTPRTSGRSGSAGGGDGSAGHWVAFSKVELL